MTFELACRDYGYDCDFVARGEDSEYVMREFGKHVDEEHGLWYSDESLKQIFQTDIQVFIVHHIFFNH